ncbi:hypothetical protein PUMCH_002137 [Australozyma saopauloensis]|uniref:NADPH:adrenodoxin oxidoreductase, mitochondrial n=1 Tax=Australozyma saopauloensis TaxID=291208 RepID=A0AAX4H8I2_9ASCO|nr:hypothetical protein PUMCH_002137 [[Candida] saopauloensis]
MISRVFIRHFRASLVDQYKVAIVGAGPAGFYTAHHLLHKSNGQPVSVDFFDRLPAPFGLSRYGVAPDHPEVKNCEEYMENLMKNDSYQTRFFGNVKVGRDITLADLKEHYHSIVLAYGCTASDNTLNIDGSDHPAVIPARKLVNWYNGHPDASEWSISLENVEDVTIIGNGNVAIDVARILLASPEGHWQPTDITSRAVEVLRKSSVKRINIVARRGILESAFTNKEIRELLNISKESGIRFVPIEESLLAPLHDKSKSLGRVEKRKLSILDKASKEAHQIDDCGRKQWGLYFQLSPKEFIANSENPNLLSSTVFEENELIEDALLGKISAVPTGKHTTLKNELVILSIGYKGNKLEGLDELNIDYNVKKNCLSNNGGRLLLRNSSDEYLYCHGWYTSGWIKHGPQGVIATTMMESFDTAEKILEDLANGIHNEAKSQADIVELLPKHTVTWNGWENIDKREKEDGLIVGKTREKLVTIDALVEASGSNHPRTHVVTGRK